MFIVRLFVINNIVIIGHTGVIVVLVLFKYIREISKLLGSLILPEPPPQSCFRVG